MDQNRNQTEAQGNQVSSNARGQQTTSQWNGPERRTGMSDRRQHDQQGGTQSSSRNMPADVRMMNEGSSR